MDGGAAVGVLAAANARSSSSLRMPRSELRVAYDPEPLSVEETSIAAAVASTASVAAVASAAPALDTHMASLAPAEIAHFCGDAVGPLGRAVGRRDGEATGLAVGETVAVAVASTAYT